MVERKSDIQVVQVETDDESGLKKINIPYSEGDRAI